MIKIVTLTSLLALVSAASAQSTASAPAASAPVIVPATAVRAVPANTMLSVTPLEEITSKQVKVGDQVAFATVSDVVEGGVVAIPRGSPVTAVIAFKTGRAVGGKSGKFEVTFKKLSLGGKDYNLRGSYRQEGRGNTVGALLGSIVISGRSAVMTPGQLANAFTAEPVTF